METAHLAGARRQLRFDPLQAALWLAGTVAVVLLFAAVGVALGRSPLPMPIVLAFGLGLLGTLALAVGRYDAAVALGVFLLAAVRIEPAPSDLVFAVLIAVALATAHLERVPLSVNLLVAAFFALNLVASLEAVDAARAAAYFAITFYLGIFGLWLAAYVCSIRRARVVVVAYLVGAGLSAGLACLALIAPFPGADAFVGRERRASSRTRTSSGPSSCRPR